MKSLIVIPWRRSDKFRQRNYEYVLDHVDLCGQDVIPIDSDPDEPFSRSQAKNNGAAIAKEEGYDVVIFHDADMIVPCDAYQTMAQRALEERRLIVGHTQYRPLDAAMSAAVIKGKRDPFNTTPVQILSGWCLGGIIAIRVDDFHEVGGYDERFRGWGCEDTAFAHSCNVVLNVLDRTPNKSIHLWHPHAAPRANPQDLQFNTRLLTRFTQCASLEELREVQTTL